MPTEARRWGWTPGAGVTGGCESPDRGAETHQFPVVTAEPPLQPSLDFAVVVEPGSCCPQET